MDLRFSIVAIKTAGLSVVSSKSGIVDKFITKKTANIALQIFCHMTLNIYETPFTDSYDFVSVGIFPYVMISVNR
jgi:hypothetical protein